MFLLGRRALHRPCLLALSVLAGCAEELPNADPPELYDIPSAAAPISEAAMAVVRIQHPAGSSGTGSFISADGLLMTNNHVLGGEACAREGCVVSISFQHQIGTLSLPAREVFAVPQHVDVGLDMAVLQIYADKSQTDRLPTPHFLSFETRSSEELLGAHVTSVGHPLGRLKKWASGYVIHADGEWFETTLFSLPGGSGSPILNDEGRIVGLLHRGAEGFDLLTRTSTQVSAIASASAGLQAALNAPLPATVISLSAPLTSEAALAHSDMFLAASTWKANVDGQPTSLVKLMGAACDKGLAKTDYDSVEELQSEVAPCFSAVDFIECRTDVGELAQASPKECPTDERAQWLARLSAVSQKELALNGSLDLSAISYSTESLSDNQSSAEQTARTNILAALDAEKPAIDFSVASYLAAYGIVSYGSLTTRELFLNYKKVPFYERSGWEIAVSSLWLYSAGQLTREQALNNAKALYHDDKVSLGAKLRIEDLLYGANEL